MKRQILLGVATAFSMVAMMAVLPRAIAQRDAGTQENDRETRRERRIANRPNVGHLDSKTHGANIRASQIIGMNIYNHNQESIGEVNDIVLDSQSGKIRYAAVTYGGFLGVGDKMFAVPWEAFTCKSEADDPDDYFLVLNVTESQLEGAKGFDQDNWPDFADTKFTGEIDKRYGIDRRNRRDRPGVNVDVDPNDGGVDVDVDRPDRDKDN